MGFTFGLASLMLKRYPRFSPCCGLGHRGTPGARRLFPEQISEVELCFLWLQNDFNAPIPLSTGVICLCYLRLSISNAGRAQAFRVNAQFR